MPLARLLSAIMRLAKIMFLKPSSCLMSLYFNWKLVNDSIFYEADHLHLED